MSKVWLPVTATISAGWVHHHDHDSHNGHDDNIDDAANGNYTTHRIHQAGDGVTWSAVPGATNYVIQRLIWAEQRRSPNLRRLPLAQHG
jgi:hypothetical protein